MAATIQSNNRRIARNTLFLYMRMGITMIVQLYTSRIVLDALGIDNYGIYNVVGSVIVMFTFVSGPLTAATQRFFSYELGRKDGGEINKIFNTSLIVYLALALLLVIVIEIVGGWYVDNRLNIPPESREAAQWVFHLSVISLVVMLLRTPFESLILSHEKMDFYAYVSVADVILKFGNALSLIYFSVDKLRLYAFNQLAVSIIITCCIIAFCHLKFSTIRLHLPRDIKAFRSLLSFSGWTLLSSVTTMGATNGVNILLNAFCGVAVNSAMGIATQVSVAINQFVTNFQVAFNPQIVKYYSSGELGLMQTLAYRASRVSYLLLLLIVCPLFCNLDFLLAVWLKEVPPYTSPLCIGLIVWMLLESLMAPLWTSITATGKIRTYHITMSMIISMVFILSWLCLYAGMSPVSVVAVKCGIDIVLIIARLLFARRLLGYSVRMFATGVIMPVSLITLVMVITMYAVSAFGMEGWTRLITSYTIALLVFVPTTYFIALTATERSALSSIIKGKLQLI